MIITAKSGNNVTTPSAEEGTNLSSAEEAATNALAGEDFTLIRKRHRPVHCGFCKQ